jgi:N-acetylmuramoyl-L-alanine amidase
VTVGTLKALLPFLGFKEAVLAPDRPETRDAAASEARVAAPLKTIVIDPGHGGYDSGAIGRRNRTYEKDACLDIGKRLAELLRDSNPGLKVVLTRDRDEFIALEDRTRLANRLKADLFISIHNNSSNDPDSHGTQVFYYDSQSSSREAAGLARRENSNANFLEMLFRDLQKMAVRDPSIRLASSVEKSITRSLKLKGRRLQYAPFYVLAMTKMPAILVETAFISNPKEERLLRTPAFRQQVAEAIFQGVNGYRQQMAGR